MLFVLISDIHGKYKTSIGRKDNIGKAFESKINYVFKWANKNGAMILQAGDLNDNPRNWEVLDFYIKAIRKWQVMIFCVFGQHDLYMRRDPSDSPSVLSILMQTGLVKILGKEPVTTNTGCKIYGANWGDEIPVPSEESKRNVLVLHAPISKKSEFPGHDYTSPEYFMKKNPLFHVVLVGDVHKKIYYSTGKYLMDKRYLVNAGPMLRVEATKYNMRHRPCFYVWDSKTNEMRKEIIPHQPANEVLTRDHIVQKNISTRELEDFANELKTMRPLGSQRRENVQKFVERNVNSPRVVEIIKEVING